MDMFSFVAAFILLPVFVWGFRTIWQWTPDTLTRAQALAAEARAQPMPSSTDAALVGGHRRFIRAQEFARRANYPR